MELEHYLERDSVDYKISLDFCIKQKNKDKKDDPEGWIDSSYKTLVDFSKSERIKGIDPVEALKKRFLFELDYLSSQKVFSLTTEKNPNFNPLCSEEIQPAQKDK